MRRVSLNAVSSTNKYLVLKYLELAKGSKRYGQKALFYRRAFPSILQGHKPVFTHADFQRKKIMITKSIKPGEPCKWSSTRLKQDWSTDELGTYSFNRHRRLHSDTDRLGDVWLISYLLGLLLNAIALRFDDDWFEWVDKVMDPFLEEYTWMHMLFHEYWC